MRNSLAQKYVARVGILQDSTHSDGKGKGILMSVLALIHIFGSISRNIPSRDFLFMPLEKKKQDLIQVLAQPKVFDLIVEGDIKKVLQIVGVKGEQIVQEAFATRGFGLWPVLKAATIRRKGSDAPLINSGALRRSVTSDVVKK